MSTFVDMYIMDIRKWQTNQIRDGQSKKIFFFSSGEWRRNKTLIKMIA